MMMGFYGSMDEDLLNFPPRLHWLSNRLQEVGCKTLRLSLVQRQCGKDMHPTGQKLMAFWEMQKMSEDVGEIGTLAACNSN